MNDDRVELNRKLSPKETERLKQFNEMIADYQNKGYQVKLHTISVKKANVIGAIIIIPVFVVLYGIYLLINGLSGIDNFTLVELFLALAAIFGLIVVHEGLHGLTWGLFCQNKFQSIEFGIIKEYLTPYCACKEPLKKTAYLLGCAMPLLVLGVLMAIITIALQSGLWLFVAANNIISAIGDVMVMIEILKIDSGDQEVLFIDHPTQAGFMSIKKEK
ncbi:MAG: DUF3267 domain-containing protein [Erysipelotrichaceae bacterium]